MDGKHLGHRGCQYHFFAMLLSVSHTFYNNFASDGRDLTHIRRQRQGRRLFKSVFIYDFFLISHLPIADLFSVFVCIRTWPC